MKIYKTSQTFNDDYDTYDSAVIVADNETEAQFTHPGGGLATWGWAPPQHVQVEYIGEADPKYTELTIICASYNAG